MRNTWRGYSLILEPSHVYAGGAVLRDPLSLRTVNSFLKKREAVQYCELNGYSVMAPPRVNIADLEEHI